MPSIHVCALSKVAQTVRATGARSLVSMMHQTKDVVRPAEIAPQRHLFVGVSDILAPQDGFVLANTAHVSALLTFMRQWDRHHPLVIHCFAGVSRSTAAAFIAACALLEPASEAALAQKIRALSPTATPNVRLVSLADGILQRGGRMIDAVAAIGRGADCHEGVPFALELAQLA